MGFGTSFFLGKMMEARVELSSESSAVSFDFFSGTASDLTCSGPAPWIELPCGWSKTFDASPGGDGGGERSKGGLSASFHFLATSFLLISALSATLESPAGPFLGLLVWED